MFDSRPGRVPDARLRRHFLIAGIVMLQSHVIDIHGVFAGAAIRNERSFRFVAVHPSLAELHHNDFVSLSDMRRVVANHLRLDRPAASNITR
jgi:hypothetical protein